MRSVLRCTGLEINKRKDGGAVARAVEAAKAAGGRVETADKHDMNLLVDHRPHQVPLTTSIGST